MPVRVVGQRVYCKVLLVCQVSDTQCQGHTQGQGHTHIVLNVGDTPQKWHNLSITWTLSGFLNLLNVSRRC